MSNGRALAPGSWVAGDWHIERMLGQGGFGVTYEVRHRTSGAHAALKEYMPSGLCSRIEGSSNVVPAQGQAGDIFKRGLAGFIKEAETLARLDHPSIVRLSEYFEANDTAYMALDYEDGGTFGDWLKHLGRAVTQRELDDLLWPLLDALIQVHSLPLLHRDIKPDNIMLRADGTPVLIDFGAAKSIVSSETRSVGGPRTLNLVTDRYAAPEQYVPEGETLLGPWTDVYALAATLYTAITGAPPIAANRRLVEESYQPLSGTKEDHIGAGWRPEFLAVVDRALSLKRSDRPQSMVEFRRALGVVEPKSSLQPASPSGRTAETPPNEDTPLGVHGAKLNTSSDIVANIPHPATLGELEHTPPVANLGSERRAAGGASAANGAQPVREVTFSEFVSHRSSPRRRPQNRTAQYIALYTFLVLSVMASSDYIFSTQLLWIDATKRSIENQYVSPMRHYLSYSFLFLWAYRLLLSSLDHFSTVAMIIHRHNQEIYILELALFITATGFCKTTQKLLSCLRKLLNWERQMRWVPSVTSTYMAVASLKIM